MRAALTVPELPEVETLRRGLAARITGMHITAAEIGDRKISHLIRARCSAGISQLAFRAWLLASVLTTARAVAIGDGVFIVLGGIQIVATALIMVCAARYQDTPCPVHLPGQPAATTATGIGTSANEPCA